MLVGILFSLQLLALLTSPSLVHAQNLLAAIDGKIWHLSPNEFEQRVILGKGTWLVNFGTTWCKYCKVLAPVWLEVQEQVDAERLIEQMFAMAKVDCTEAKEWCANHRVTAYPTIYVYHDGVQVDEYHNGFKTENIIAFIREKMRSHAAIDRARNAPEVLASPSTAPLVLPGRISPIQKPSQKSALALDRVLAEKTRSNNDASLAHTTARDSPQIVMTHEGVMPLEPLYAQTPPLQERKAPGPPVGMDVVNDAIPDLMNTTQSVVREFHGIRRIMQQTALLPLLGPECSTALLQFEVFRRFDCTQLLASKVAGSLVVAGGAFLVNGPALMGLWMGKGAEQLSIMNYSLNTGVLVARILYNLRFNYPVSTWGEQPFVVATNCFVMALVLKQFKRSEDTLALVFCTLVFSACIFGGALMNDAVLWMLQLIAVGVEVSVKVPQIRENFNFKGCEDLSLNRAAFLTLGSLTRCFTTITELQDPVVLISYMVTTVLNALVLQQAVMFGGTVWKRKALLD
ncbi:hypothetical protein BC830DRAFT_1150346 [Chytriomyces sp. MP71]|nr:hypothetical protein BC830DRAFT_1150346 [Chytriomyces sp. MP71]